jgi:nucleoside-diphosphate-sugar epimerase
MMQVLITGAAGKIGSFLIEELKGSYEITAYDQKPVREKDIRFVRGDVRDSKTLADATKGMDAIIHLAGVLLLEDDENGIPVIMNPEDHMLINVLGTLNVLESAASNGVKRVIFASSDSAYGFVFAVKKSVPLYLPIDEKHPLLPQDAYGLSKLLGEELCKAYTRRCGIETICLRCCLVAFPDFYENYGEIIKMSELNNKRMWGYVDVRDVVVAYRLALEVRNPEHEAFLIAAKNTFYPEPTQSLIHDHYSGVEIIKQDLLRDEQGSLYNIAKARTVLGYDPKFDWNKLVHPNETKAGE